MDKDLALKVYKAAWHAAGANSREALRDLEGIVSDTNENLEAGEPVVGGPRLEQTHPVSSGFFANNGGIGARKAHSRSRCKRRKRGATRRTGS